MDCLPETKSLASVQRWPLYRGGCCTEVAVVQRWLLYRGGRCAGVASVQRWPLYRGGCCTEVAVVQRWLLYRGGRCAGVASVQRWPLYRDGRFRKVAVAENKGSIELPFIWTGGSNPVTVIYVWLLLVTSNSFLPLRPHMVLDCQKLMGTQLWR